MHSAVEHAPQCSILYDADRLPQAPREWFEPARLQSNGWIRGHASGRGAAWLFQVDGRDMVLRHYRRGGAVAALLGDRYFGLFLGQTRAWREFRLLARLWQSGLPVPRPVAARVCLARPVYRCDLITVRIEGAESLADRWLDGRLGEADWRRVGATIRRFHDQRVRHADLNARNLLFDAGDQVYLIDFDRGRIGSAGGSWRRANLERLQRSLRKIADQAGAVEFDPAGWRALEHGYAGGSA